MNPGFYGQPMGGQGYPQQQQYMQGRQGQYPGAKGGQQMYMNNNQKGGGKGKGNRRQDGKGKGQKGGQKGAGRDNRGPAAGQGPHQGQPANPNSWAAKVQVA